MAKRQEHARVATALLGADTLLREGLVRILAGTSFRVSAVAPNIGELCFSAPENRPGLVIVAEESPGGAAHHLRELRKAYPRVCLALLAAACDLDNVKAASRAGANAYLFTAMTAEALVRALELAMSGIVVLPNAVLAALCDGSQPPRRKPEGTADALDDAGCEAPARPEREGPDVSTPCDPATKVRPARPLSGREVDILHWITQGDSNKQIARRFDIRDTTVKVHVKAILRKIGARNRTEAATWVLRHGLPAPAPVREPNGGLPASHVLTREEVDELPMGTIDGITALQSVREYRTPDADGTSRRVIEFEGGARFEVIYDDGEPVDYRAERVRFESRAGRIVVSGAALSCATAVEAQGAALNGWSGVKLLAACAGLDR